MVGKAQATTLITNVWLLTMCGFGIALVRGGMAGLFGLVAVSTATAEPVKFRLGYGGAAEEPMWLIVAKPDLAKNYGKAYTLEATKFTSSDKRAQAFEAGA